MQRASAPKITPRPLQAAVAYKKTFIMMLEWKLVSKHATKTYWWGNQPYR